MADRVSATITIGGALAQAKLPDLLDAITAEGLATEWDAEPFTLAELPADAALRLMAHEVPWGRFEELEAFCVREALALRAGPAPIPDNGAPSASFSPAPASRAAMRPMRRMRS